MEGIFQISLIAAFTAGMVALFAPCCITFLLPAYLGSVFKEKEKVLFMTLVFGLGIFVTLFPAVIGVGLISKLLFRYHDNIYYLGGFVLLFISVITFLGIKLPMPMISQNSNNKKVDIISVFVMGIFSGITSACCAPVLVGILTFAFLSPNIIGAILIGAVYVLGMVTPLLLMSLFLNGKVDKMQFLRKPVGKIKILGRTYYIMTSNLIASMIFFLTGFLTLGLNYQGKLSMAKSEVFGKMIQNAGGYVNQYVGNNLLLNIAFLIAIILFVYYVSKKF
ncbi:MAG: hypothetical protein M1405_03525 [Patescibacteria group bacterium]|nr:hypothetical protein [Patescibacteria group bacterium]